VTGLLRLWRDKCDVYEYAAATKANGATGFEKKLVFSGVPCRVSYGGVKRSGNSLNEAGREVKLFLSCEYAIKAGSEIRVTRNGTVTVYKNSSPPAVYSGHQEILLEEL